MRARRQARGGFTLRHAERGFTLMELIIAITLLGMLSAGLLMAMHNGLLTMERTNARLDENRRAMGVLSLIRRQVSAMIPLKGLCPGQSAGQNPVQSNRMADFFRGDGATMVFVSSESMSQGSRGYPQIVRYQFRPNPDGTVRLEAIEQVYSGAASTTMYCQPGFPQAEGMPVPVVLYGRLGAGGFAYYQVRPDTRATLGWVGGWLAPFMPAAVRIEMTPAPGNAPRLPLTSLTIPLRTSREQLTEYIDEPPQQEQH
jgi:prepilin-type N-terminal cleavage/methylation domain-containing protein